MSTVTLVIGPEHNGQRMSLDDFENAEVREGLLYELGRGVVVVNQAPNLSHFYQVDEIRRQLSEFQLRASPSVMHIAAGSDCKILLQEFGSERHADLSLYLGPPPAGIDDSEVWALWIPDIVVEVVSPSSGQRDYTEKPDEYLQFGIKEYWIIDAKQQLMTALQRSRGKWVENKLKPPAKHVTHLLPDLEFDIQAVFEAATRV